MVGLPGPRLPDASTVAPLAAPPRPVPLAFRLAAFDWSWWGAFCLFLALVAPLALWILVPGAFAVGLLVLAALVVLLRGRRFLRRDRILRWGEVATVTGVRVVERGTYYSGVTYGNARLRSAHGWTATTQWYSGPGTTTDVTYTARGQTGTLRLRGLPYVDGVVLADSRHPERAMCVSQLPYDLTPGPDGQWRGVLSVGTLVGVACALVVELSLLGAAVAVALDSWG